MDKIKQKTFKILNGIETRKYKWPFDIKVKTRNLQDEFGEDEVADVTDYITDVLLKYDNPIESSEQLLMAYLIASKTSGESINDRFEDLLTTMGDHEADKAMRSSAENENDIDYETDGLDPAGGRGLHSHESKNYRLRKLIQLEIRKVLKEDDYYEKPIEWEAHQLTEYQVRDFEKLINEKFPIHTIYNTRPTNSWCIDEVEEFPPTSDNGNTKYFIYCTDDNTGKLSESFRSKDFHKHVERDGSLSSHERPNEIVYKYEE